jgi:threonine aldolase
MTVDLRSDTVTRPTEAMYEAMRSARLGDDVYGDDPTVNELEELAAKMLGKEAALFVPSGTMGNQIAIATQTKPGDSIIVEEEAHILYYEGGGPALHSGVVSWTLPSIHGAMDPELIEAHVLERSEHTPGTALLCAENTHNRKGGTIIPLATMAKYRDLADKHHLKFHLDGARVFNAAVGLGVPVKEIAQYADSVNFCLSKGLRAPVGSLLCGSKQMITDGRFWRKRFGGGMRQAGILASCGILSLTKYVDRLVEDHRRAKCIATKISEIPGLQVDLDSVQTNMVFITTDKPAKWWVDELHKRDIWCAAYGSNRIRLVFHADVDDDGVTRAIGEIESIAGAAIA